MWSQFKRFEGETLYTLDRRNPFDVVRVTRSQLIVSPHKSGDERILTRQVLEGAYQTLQQKTELTRGDIQANYSGWSSAYVAALLAQLPDVSYRIRPIRLYYRS